MESILEEARIAHAKAVEKFNIGHYHSAKKYATDAQDVYPGMKDISQMIANMDIFIASEKEEGEEPDWYRVLGVDPSCDVETVKKQYKKLALKYHPDKNNAVGADGAFKLIGEANSILSNNNERSEYDRKRAEAKAKKLEEEEARLKAQMEEEEAARFKAQMAGYESYGFQHYWNQTSTPYAQGSSGVPHSSTYTYQFPMADAGYQPHGFRPWNGTPTPDAQGSHGVHRSSSELSQFPLVEEDYLTYGFNRYWYETSTADVQGTNQVHHSTGGTSQAPVAEPKPRAPTTSVRRGQSSSSSRPRKRKKSQKPESFWTTCPHCLFHFEFAKSHLNATILCDNCETPYLATVTAPPPGF